MGQKQHHCHSAQPVPDCFLPEHRLDPKYYLVDHKWYFWIRISIIRLRETWKCYIQGHLFPVLLQPSSFDLHIETIILQILIVSRRLFIMFIASRSLFPVSWILKEKQVPSERTPFSLADGASCYRVLVLLDWKLDENWNTEEFGIIKTMRLIFVTTELLFFWPFSDCSSVASSRTSVSPFSSLH